MALRNVRVWTNTGEEMVVRLDIPSPLPDGLPTVHAFFQNWYCWADGLAEVVTLGTVIPIIGNILPTGLWQRMNTVVRFRVLDSAF